MVMEFGMGRYKSWTLDFGLDYGLDIRMNLTLELILDWTALFTN